jgi:selenium metabolism protein YedF
MKRVIDARGLACPQPVVLTSKAMAETDQVTTIVDNAVAVENVSRLAKSKGFAVEVSQKSDGICLNLSKGGAPAEPVADAEPSASPQPQQAVGPIVCLIATDSLGYGPEELGERLMGAFFYTLLEVSPKPNTVIFMNTGVKLTVEGSRALDDLRALAAQGVDILACGTCLGYFDLTAKLAVGRVSNMYDIATALLGAGRLVQF